jgi:integrase
MVFRRHGRPTFYLKLPTRTGWVQRSTDTSDRAVARAMARMLVELGPHGARAWDLLDAVYERRLTLGRLFDAWQMDDLAGLRERMRDVDLTSHVPGWLAWLTDRIRPDTAQHYEAHLRTLMPEGTPFWRSQLTAPAVARWLATRTALAQKRRPSSQVSRRRDFSRRREDPTPRSVSGATKRKYLAAVQSFSRYLVAIGELASNPLRDVSPPPAAGPRCLFLELPDVLRLVEGTAPPYRAVFALAYGAGLEVSAILSLVDADIDSQARQFRAKGTKAWTRDRLARVADWAWPALQEHLATVLPGERVFRGLDRWQAGDVHRERLRALGLEGFRLHDARHHWAVRMARAGAPFELIARQLGHRDVAMVAKVYGRFKPDTEERDRWEHIASDRDAEKWGGKGAARGAKAEAESEKQDEESPATLLESEASGDSRGGTRTRDPGIMSAVL